jgi:hypothetical protein
MCKRMRLFTLSLVAIAALLVVAAAPEAWAQTKAPFEEARIFIEYNSTDNDLGFHVFLDAEDWKTLRIVDPNGQTIYQVAVRGGFKKFGLSEMFFEGAEPSLDDVSLDKLLELFPEGKYTFIGTTVDGTLLESTATLLHAIPAGPKVSAEVAEGVVTIQWQAVTAPPEGFPDRPIKIVGYQVIVEPFQVTLPASNRQVTLPPEFVASLGTGKHGFEVLAIDESGNQTITQGSFKLP